MQSIRIVTGLALAVSVCFSRISSADVLAEYDVLNHQTPGSVFFQAFVDNTHDLVGETFQVPAPAILNSVQLPITWSAGVGTSQSLTASLYATTQVFPNGSQPTGSPLASETFPPTSFQSPFIEYVTFDFGSVSLAADTDYDILVSSPSTSEGYSIYGSQPGGYANGDEIALPQSGGATIWAHQTGTNLGFIVNGTLVPEPGTIGVVALAAVAGLTRRRRSTRALEGK